MIVNTEVLQLVAVGSLVLAKLWGALLDRLPFWKRLPDIGREIGGYVIMVVNAALMWSTGFDMLPGFGVEWPMLGRVLTCIVAAAGPSLVFDMLLDKSKPTD